MEKTVGRVASKTVVAVFIALLSVAMITAVTTEQAYAKSSQALTTTKANPYTDVNKKTVDAKGIAAVKYVKAHKGFDGVIKGDKFYPNKPLTKRSLIKILQNMYGVKNVPITKTDKATMSHYVTGKYTCEKLTQVSKKLGVPIKWKSGATKNKLTRTGVANYIKVFAQFDPAFKPRR